MRKKKTNKKNKKTKQNKKIANLSSAELAQNWKGLAPKTGTLANSIDPDHNASSAQGLHYLHLKYKIICKDTIKIK